ncbi:MAG: GNAT family N-acetyltransferase [Proteobacteria bacterium]|nr:GNAT family N-acetyltransferase [Pseudomonadota bacterium]
MSIQVQDYEVRLAMTEDERRRVRRLRYDVFVEEEGFKPTNEQQKLREEYDRYDAAADYMAVFHDGRIIATYRIIDRNAAEKMDGFYSEDEYDISKIRKIRGNIIEISRACVAREYRDNPLAMSMLWLGMCDYVFNNKIVLLFGLCSWVGLNPAASAQAISYLYYNHLAPRSLRAAVVKEAMEEKGLDPRLSRMKILPRDFVDRQMARAEMTPLLKGYLNLGATFGNGVSTDIAQNSYVVMVILQTKNIKKVYQKHFAGNENAFAHLGIEPGAWKKFGKTLLHPITNFATVSRFLMKS